MDRPGIRPPVGRQDVDLVLEGGSDPCAVPRVRELEGIGVGADHQDAAARRHGQAAQLLPDLREGRVHPPRVGVLDAVADAVRMHGARETLLGRAAHTEEHAAGRDLDVVVGGADMHDHAVALDAVQRPRLPLDEEHLGARSARDRLVGGVTEESPEEQARDEQGGPAVAADVLRVLLDPGARDGRLGIAVQDPLSMVLQPAQEVLAQRVGHELVEGRDGQRCAPGPRAVGEAAAEGPVAVDEPDAQRGRPGTSSSVLGEELEKGGGARDAPTHQRDIHVMRRLRQRVHLLAARRGRAGARCRSGCMPPASSWAPRSAQRCPGSAPREGPSGVPPRPPSRPVPGPLRNPAAGRPRCGPGA